MCCKMWCVLINFRHLKSGIRSWKTERPVYFPMIPNLLLRFKSLTQFNILHKSYKWLTTPQIVQHFTQRIILFNRGCHCVGYDKELNFIDFSSTITEEEKCTILKNMLIFDSYLSPDEEKSLLGEIEPYMKRLRYEFDHWDNVSRLH